MEQVLKNVNYPSDLKKLSSDELIVLAREIRELIIETVSNTGGHLAPSLGAVELTIALHLALQCPKDKIIWDVGHQCYAHKILTGRKEKFPMIRQHNGISGFPKKNESRFDFFDAGHASSSISVALGMAKARDILDTDENIVAVIGDGALTGGMSFEALNQAGHQKSKLIVILNDNNMSIARNVGAMSSYLSKIRLDPMYNRFKEDVEERIRKIPGIGELVVNVGENLRESFKHLVVPGLFFEELGFRYIGPVDGHNITELKEKIELAKEAKKPVLIHAYTVKGKGYKPAIKNADTFHGTSPFIISTGKPKAKPPQTYTSVFGDTMVKIGINEPRLIGITAAMAAGTGLKRFSGEFPERFFDVGIAEQHAVTFGAGLATRGLLPVVAIYSTFLQRAYDQIIQDCALQKLHMILAVDRAGLVGEDGPTHHGALDLTYLRSVPNIILMSPKDENELQHMLYSATQYNALVAIRYPRGKAKGVKLDVDFKEIPVGKAEMIKEGKDVVFWAIGSMVGKAEAAAKKLEKSGVSTSVVNARFAKPLDKNMLAKIPEGAVVVTLEESSLIGGFGSAVLESLNDLNMQRTVLRLGLPDRFMSHGSTSELMEEAGLSVKKIVEAVSKVLNKPVLEESTKVVPIQRSENKTKA
jgi:1-deoxy-D-xylulose-5-phosphate synthase